MLNEKKSSRYFGLSLALCFSVVIHFTILLLRNPQPKIGLYPSNELRVSLTNRKALPLGRQPKFATDAERTHHEIDNAKPNDWATSNGNHTANHSPWRRPKSPQNPSEKGLIDNALRINERTKMLNAQSQELARKNLELIIFDSLKRLNLQNACQITLQVNQSPSVVCILPTDRLAVDAALAITPPLPDAENFPKQIKFHLHPSPSN